MWTYFKQNPPPKKKTNPYYPFNWSALSSKLKSGWSSPCLSCLWASLFTVAAGATGTAGRSRWMLFQPIIQDRTPTEKCLCVYMCLSSPHLPRQFHDHHGDRHNNQWQSEMQLRAGISLSSQPIRAKMLRDLEGHAEPYKSTAISTYMWTSTDVYILGRGCHFFSCFDLPYRKQTKGWKCQRLPWLLSSTIHTRHRTGRTVWFPAEISFDD